MLFQKILEIWANNRLNFIIFFYASSFSVKKIPQQAQFLRKVTESCVICLQAGSNQNEIKKSGSCSGAGGRQFPDSKPLDHSQAATKSEFPSCWEGLVEVPAQTTEFLLKVKCKTDTCRRRPRPLQEQRQTSGKNLGFFSFFPSHWLLMGIQCFFSLPGLYHIDNPAGTWSGNGRMAVGNILYHKEKYFIRWFWWRIIFPLICSRKLLKISYNSEFISWGWVALATLRRLKNISDQEIHKCPEQGDRYVGGVVLKGIRTWKIFTE